MTQLGRERIEQFISDPLEYGLTRSEQMEMSRRLLAVEGRVPDVSDLEKVLRFIEGLPVPTNGAAKNGKRLCDFIVTCRAAMLQPSSGALQLPDWTDEQCLEFLSIAFRHAEIKGDLELDDIRLGVKMVNASPAAPQEPTK